MAYRALGKWCRQEFALGGFLEGGGEQYFTALCMKCQYLHSFFKTIPYFWGFSPLSSPPHFAYATALGT